MPEKTTTTPLLTPSNTEATTTTPDTTGDTPQTDNTNFIDIPSYPTLNVDKLYAGLPVYTAIPTEVKRQGETVLVDTGSVRSVCSYLGGVWYCRVIGGAEPVSSPMTLLHAGSGTDTHTTTTIVDSHAITGLTALDTIIIYFTASQITQNMQGLGVWNTTDNIKLSLNGNLAAGNSNGGNIILMQEQHSDKDVFTQSNSQYSSFVNTGAGPGGGTIQGFIESNTFTTAWTGSWTLGFGHEGITSGGTLRWSWRVYKIAGQ